jgi:hypothetical protein
VIAIDRIRFSGVLMSFFWALDWMDRGDKFYAGVCYERANQWKSSLPENLRSEVDVLANAVRTACSEKKRGSQARAKVRAELFRCAEEHECEVKLRTDSTVADVIPKAQAND